MSNTTRPTYVDRKKYLRFINKCKKENQPICNELNNFFDLYCKKGHKLFN